MSTEISELFVGTNEPFVLYRCSSSEMEGFHSGADPGFFLGGGALVSCSTSTPINHIVFFFAEYQLYLKTSGHLRGGGDAHPLHPPPRSTPAIAIHQELFFAGGPPGQDGGVHRLWFYYLNSTNHFF